jgi:hypothetical protein
MKERPMAGRPETTKDFPKILLRLPPALLKRIEHCHLLLQRQHGPKTTQTKALWEIIEAGCDALEGKREGRETPVSVPGQRQAIPNPFSYVGQQKAPIKISSATDPETYQALVENAKASMGVSVKGTQGQTALAPPGRSEISSMPSKLISEISETPPMQIAEISEIAGDDFDVPGYGFPEDEDEMPAPQRNGTAQHAPVSPEPRILDVESQPEAAPEHAATLAPASQPKAPEAPVQTAELSETIVKIAEARAQYDKLSERAFIQLLYDRGMYRHQAKDGSEVPLPHSTYRDWMQRAREAGLL